MKKYRISAVSYVNTYPFLFGIKEKLNSDIFELEKDVPSICAQKLIDNEVDIGLVPVASLPKIPNANIISDYCIGSFKEVKTVILASKVPLSEIKKIYLDTDSRTSVNLIKVLSEKYWKKCFEYEKLNLNFSDVDSAVLIGDKTFNLKAFDFVYDLSKEWFDFTGLPFVFAVWVSNKNINESFKNELNNALKYGIENIDLSLNSHIDNGQRQIYLDYLNDNIDYIFDEKKKLAMDKFLAYLK